MTGLEIINLGAEGVKKTPEALQAYKTLFFEMFGKTPECPACGTSLGLNDWKAFNEAVEGLDIEDIKRRILGFSESELEKTFTIKRSHDIIRYNEFRDGRWFVHRSYTETMTESFAIGLLESAETDAQFEELSKLFHILPAKFREGSIEKEVDELLNDETGLNLDEVIDEEVIDEVIDAVNETPDVIEEDPTVEEIIEDEVIETDEEKEARIKEEKNAARRARDKAARDAKKAAEEQK